MQGLSLRRSPPEALNPARKPQSDWMYRLHWNECPPLVAKAEDSRWGWLILADRAGVGAGAREPALSGRADRVPLIHVDSLNDARGVRTRGSPGHLVERFTAALRGLVKTASVLCEGSSTFGLWT